MSAKKEKPTTANSNHPSTLKAARRCLAIGLISAAIAVAALACQEERAWSPDPYIREPEISCGMNLRMVLKAHPKIKTAEIANQTRVHPQTKTAEIANEAIAGIQAQRPEMCSPKVWNPRISLEPQSCQLSAWKGETATPATLAETAQMDIDGLTIDPAWNVLVDFTEKPTGEYEARCWMYIATESRWTVSLDE